MPKKYKYAFHRFHDFNPIAKGSDQGATWILEKINELGSRGIRVINLNESYETSNDVDGLGRPVPYYVINVLGEEVVISE